MTDILHPRFHLHLEPNYITPKSLQFKIIIGGYLKFTVEFYFFIEVLIYLWNIDIIFM